MLFSDWIPDFDRYVAIVDHQRNPGCCSEYREMGALPHCPVCARYRPVSLDMWRERRILET